MYFYPQTLKLDYGPEWGPALAKAVLIGGRSL